MSQATVSKAITRLENRLNVVLLRRSSRGVSVTDAGYAVLEKARQIVEYGEQMESTATEQVGKLSGLIRVAAPMSFGISHFAPMLPDFMAAHPDVELHVDLSDDRVDLITNRFDFALRISHIVESSLVTQTLCTVRKLLVGSPAYFERYGRPKHPQDLIHHKALHYSYSPDGRSWKFHHNKFGSSPQIVPTPLQINNAEALIPALNEGLGLALQPEFLTWKALQSGQLETAMDDWQVEPVVLHLAFPPGRPMPKRVQALVDYLTQRLNTEPWALPTHK